MIPANLPLSTALLNYFTTPATLIAVVPMMVVTVWALIHEFRHPKTHPLYYLLFAVGLLVTPFFSIWDIEFKNNSFSGGLHVLFAGLVLFSIILANQKRFFVRLPTFVVLNFLIILIADLVIARYPHVALGLGRTTDEMYLKAEVIKSMVWWFDGVGGAGFLDALVVNPLFAVLLWFLIARPAQKALQADADPTLPDETRG